MTSIYTQYDTEDVNVYLDITPGMTSRKFLIDEVPDIDARFNKLTARMQNLLDDVRIVFPDASYYADQDGGFNLLLGKAHNVDGMAQRRLLALESQSDFKIEPGEW